ncbi:N-formylglutamate deformylase [Thalassotalea sp. HSM 43]|uniref:N-formylglutamate deformylase n=1 Tax=Thalassotalea sp. HSM 43 TaxID=2552945 RepID=UPI0010820F58|nr:N-formylglutamate deformylase [Thalassotalea sp. HSM 43]QBY04279.1 N-formylglutamate deformylase [Thalassotalea sp. HSM 43]
MSQASYTLIEGSLPLLISMPHNGTEIPEDIKAVMTDVAGKVEDTDWYLDRLYDFAKAMGAYILMPKYNRYVIDLNRDPSGVSLYPGADTTELCPTSSFKSESLYLAGKKPDQQEIDRRVDLYWQPYHQAISDTLAQIKQRFGKAVMLEAHSIASVVPRFFDGQLPDFNFGNNSGESCAAEMLHAIEQLDFAPYSQVSNGRFKGGYITRAYAKPDANIHTLQLELSQRTYLDEDTLDYDQQKADAVKPKLHNLVKQLIEFAQQ